PLINTKWYNGMNHNTVVLPFRNDKSKTDVGKSIFREISDTTSDVPLVAPFSSGITLARCSKEKRIFHLFSFLINFYIDHVENWFTLPKIRIKININLSLNEKLKPLTLTTNGEKTQRYIIKSQIKNVQTLILSIIYFTFNLTDSSRVHIISEANKEHLCYGNILNIFQNQSNRRYNCIGRIDHNIILLIKVLVILFKYNKLHIKCLPSRASPPYAHTPILTQCT
ncbi:hypothetical protein AGLY_008238, partial [Aphis glycines]